MAQLTKQDVKNALWEKGILKWKMTHAEYRGKILNHKVQVEMYEQFKKAPENSTIAMLLSRQTGKTFWLSILANEQALQKPGSIIKILADTKLHVETIIIPKFNELFSDCPEHLKPKYDKTKYIFNYPNGSQIQLAGTDNGHFERLRGSVCDLVLIDEAGFCQRLKYIVDSVLTPTTTHTGGKIVMVSTPPLDPDHEFLYFIEKAELEGTLIKKTIYDNPLLSADKIENLKEQMGGENSPAWRREYLCEIIRDDSKIVFPEFDDDLQMQIVKDWPMPTYYDCYVGMDLGGSKDYTVALYMYYDFLNDKLVFQDELVYGPKDLLPDMVREMQQKETQLWTNHLTNEQTKPYMRVSDINHIATQEIARLSNYEMYFQAPQKDDKEIAINNIRVMLSSGKIIISPKCQTLIRHLTNCKWKNTSNSSKVFARSADHGHYDAVDAFIYAIRAVNFRRNPYPVGYDTNLRREDVHVQNPRAFDNYASVNSPAQVFKKIFSKRN